ncbi:hypothetical protein ACFQS3_02770 [Glycomyces mayteni]|uniref:Zn-dependent protease with chaperone function n=2 Tax=Glycomyces mayteni TaxID=543887 RepID=A0ABW2D228_9ACTN|nr:hypothetical protein GCM10025732_48570 [Glycomyces mayteni]
MTLVLLWGFAPWALLSAALLSALVIPLAQSIDASTAGVLLGWFLVAAVLLITPVAALRDLPEPLQGESVDRERAPELWALVEEVAAAVGGTVPDEILVDNGSGVYTQRTSRHGVRRTVLLIGVDVFTPRTVGLFRAMLAVHMGGSATAGLSVEGRVWGWHLYLTGLFAKYPANPLNLLLWPYAALCFAATSRITGARVLAGDRAAAAYAGGPNTWSTIAEIQVLDRMWARFLTTHLQPAVEVGLLPFDVSGGFARFLDALAEERAALRAEPLSGRTAWNATHPSLAKRVAALVEVPGEARPGDEAPALSLFPDHRVAAMVDVMWKSPGTVRASWEEVADRVEHHRHCARAARSYQVLGGLLGPSRASLEGLLAEIDTGRRDALFLELDRRGFPAGGLASTVAMAAFRSQEMRAEIRWGEGTGLVGADGRPFDPKALIAPLFAAAPDTDAVRKALADRGVDLHRAVAEG